MRSMALADQEKLYLIDRIEKSNKEVRRTKEQEKDDSNLYLGAAIASATSGFIGFYEGRQGKGTFGGHVIPLDLTIAAVGCGYGLYSAKKDRDRAKLFFTAGLAGASICTYKLGRELGARSVQTAAAAPVSSASGVAGVLPAHNPHTGLSDAEISRLIEASRAIG